MKLKNILPMTLILLVLFTSSCEKDENSGARPKVTSTNPISQADRIAINSKISATFNMAMESSTITTESFTLKQGTTMVPGAVTYSDTTAFFSSSVNLIPNTSYTATITSAAKSAAGSTLIKDYSWSFTTGAIPDITLPAVTLTSPLNNATGVAVDKPVVIKFSEPIDPSTVTSLTFIVKQGTTLVSGVVTNTDSTATFTPTGNLNPGELYTGTINTGVKDMAGNALAANYTFSFTTAISPDIALPMVNATVPLINTTGIARNNEISLTFSEAMDPLTINTSTFLLKQGTTAISGTVDYSGKTATFTPSNPLLAGTAYTATITTGAKDLAGNALAANTVWSFTTGGSVSTLGIVDLGAAGNYVILAKTAINNNSTSAITGDLGLSPAATSYATGFALTNATGYATSSQITGKIYAADMADPTPINLTTAVNNMILAYNDAAGRPSPDFSELGTGNIGGKTLVPGLYKWTNTVSMPSDVTISGGANDVWIFQIAGNLTMSPAVKITLIGGAQAKNIFWQVAGQVTLGTTTHFEGIILSSTGITFQTGASMNGRALAQTAVILDSNAITKPQ